MKQFFTLLVSFVFLCIYAQAQPLPCPPLRTTTIAATGATTICRGNSATLGNTHTTAIKSTSSYDFSRIPYLPTAYDGSGNTGGTANVLIHVDDEYTSVVPIPFEFCFYGTKYNSCVIGANGEICFNTSLAGGSCPWSISGPIPTSGELNDATLNTIMGVYQDIDPGIAGSVNWAVFGTAPCRTFVVSWNQVPYFDGSLCLPDTNTQQIVLYESTYAIDIFVKHKPVCTAWNGGLAILGLCDATGANYNVPPEYNATVFSMDDSGFRFTPSAPATWTYVWSDAGGVVGTDSSLTISPTTTTTYTVTGIASTNCDSYKVTSPVVVTVLPDISISSTSFTNPTLCGACDGTITLYGLPPSTIDTIKYKYNGVWQPNVIQTSSGTGTITLTGLCADVTGATGGVGTYDSISLIETGGCRVSPVGPIRLTNPPISISFINTTNPSSACTADGTMVLEGLYPAHTYTVTFDKNGTPQTPIAATSSSSGTITITGLTGTPPLGDVYSNIVAAFPACTTPARGPYTLLGPNALNISILTFTNPSQCGYCDGTIELGNVPPLQPFIVNYMKDGVAQPAITVTSRTDSTILIVNTCDRSIYSNFTVTTGPCIYTVAGSALMQAPPITDSFYNVVHLGCNGDSVFFYNLSTNSGPLYYVWNFGDGTTDRTEKPMHIFAQGVYTVTLSAGNHVCTDTFTVKDSLVHPLKAIFTETPDIICQKEPVTFTNNSIGTAATYAWNFGNGSNGSTTANPTYTYNNTGVYKVQLIATDFVPCSDTAYATVYVDSTSPISLQITDSVLCRSTYTTFYANYTAVGNTGITWNFGNGDSILNVNPVQHAFDGTGSFLVTATAHFRACRDTSVSKVVTVYQMPSLDLADEYSICPGSESLVLADNLNLNTAHTSWLWSTGATTPGITVVEPGVYTLTVNISGCINGETITVKNDCYMNIPNVFTPNNDGLNDYFFPRQYLTSGLTTFSMSIYNRWGQLVFESTSLDGRGWDGKFNGVDQIEGVYVYIIDATFKDGQKEHHQGNVTLLR